MPTRTVSGLLFRDDFLRGNPTVVGNGWVEHSTAFRVQNNRLEVENNLQNQYCSQSGISAGKMLVQCIMRSNAIGVSNSVSVGARWDHNGGNPNGYYLQMNMTTGNQFVRIVLSANGSLSNIGNVNRSLSNNTNYDCQLFVDDDVQEAWFDGDTIAAADATHNGTSGRTVGVRGNSPSSVALKVWDNVVVVRDKIITVSGLTSGQKAKVLDGSDAVVREATESGGVATIQVSRFDGCGEQIPYDGWAALIITDAGDTELERYDSTGVYPGDEYAAGGFVPSDAPTLTVEEGAAAAQLFTSGFSSSQDGETHAQTQWQVTTDDDTDFSAPVVNVTSSTALLGYLADALEGETHYIARARHEGTLGGFSDWSDVVAFTTLAALPAPSLTVAALTDVDVEITSSDFDPDDPERVHVATEWELDVESGDFSSPLESYTTALDLLVATFDGLDPETGYQVRARHIDDLGQRTAWGLVSFTTEATPDYRPDTPEITLISATPRESTVLWDTLYNVTVGLLYPYSHPNSVAHQRTQWQYVIGDDPSEDFALPSRSVVQNSPSTSWQVGSRAARDPFVANQVYQFRVRVQDENDVWSEWSPAYELVIDGPLRPPTLLTPEGGAVVSTDAVLVTWTEYRDPDYEADDHIYELAITRDGGGTWTVIDDSIVIGYSDEPEYLWYLGDLLDGPAQLRIRSLSPNETEWGYGDVFYVDRDTGNVTRIDRDNPAAGWTLYGDQSQPWSLGSLKPESCDGDPPSAVSRLAAATITGGVRRTDWSVYAPDLPVVPVEVDVAATFGYHGSGIGGDQGVAAWEDVRDCPGGPGCNPCLGVQRSYSSVPARENWGGVAVDVAGTYANAGASGEALRGVAAYLRFGEIWPFGGPQSKNFRGYRYAQNSNDAVLRVRIETPSSASPGGNRAKATITKAFPRNSFQHRGVGCPDSACRRVAIPHTVRLRFTIEGQNPDDGSPTANLYTVRIRAQVTGALSSRGTQKAGWDIDVVRFNFDVQCGACGLFGAGIDYASNVTTQQIHFESLTYQLIRSAALGPALGTPSVEG